MTAKEVWDTLKTKHANTCHSLAAFYTRVGMLTKVFTEGKSMHTHLTFFIMENHKLDTKAFNDKFLAQLMLMPLPHDSTWELLTVALLQSTSDTNPLTAADVTSHLMQEYCCLESTDGADSAMLAARYGRSTKPPDKRKKCDHCDFKGHIIEECQMRKREEGEVGNKGTTGI